ASLSYVDGAGVARDGTPTREYVHPLLSAARPVDAALDAGAYEYNSGGSAVPPTITTPPANQTVTAGQSATFSVTASGTAPLSYQWLKNGASIGGATSSSYSTPATTLSQSGATFQVIVSNGAGSVTSSAATLMVTSPPSSSGGSSSGGAGGGGCGLLGIEGAGILALLR